MVLREESQAFANVAFSRLSLEMIEAIEEDRRADVLSQARDNGGLFLIHPEMARRPLVPTWELVDDSLVLTSSGLFKALDHDPEVRLSYSRVPCSSERDLLPEHFDQLLAILDRLPADQPLVLNDQSGASRSTVASVIAR